jgi:hypothetical protein
MTEEYGAVMEQQLAGENQSSREANLSHILYTSNLTLIIVGLNPDVYGEKQVTNRSYLPRWTGRTF